MHNPIGRWPLVLFGMILIGCAGGAGPRAARRNLGPATTQSSAPRTIRFADGAQAIDHFQADDHDVDLRNVIHFDEKNSAADVYFGQCERTNADGDVTETFPLIVATVNGKKGGWRGLSLADPRLANAEWQFVAAGPGDNEMWGILDDTLTDKGKIVLLAHSTDGGAAWTISSIDKPFEAGGYDSFAMDVAGRGRLTVYVAPTKNHPRRGGFYHFRTTDGGKTWLPPEHEPDGLDPADQVPEDEDPEPLKSIPTQTARASAAAVGTLSRP